MRALVLAAALAGCAARHAGPVLSVPPPETGKVRVVAQHVPPIGSVQPIAVALTNGMHEGLRLDPLPATTLEEGFSATGYVYYPAGTYHTLEVLLAETRSGAVRRERAALGETP